MTRSRIDVLFLMACLASSIDITAHGQSTSDEIIDACLAARESELGRYRAEFEYSGKFLADGSVLKPFLVEGSFSSIVKRDGRQAWYGGYKDRQLTCVYTQQDGTAFHFAPIHRLAKRLRSPAVLTGQELTCDLFVDPLGLGFFETDYEPLAIERARSILFLGHDTGEVLLTRQDAPEKHSWVITSTKNDEIIELSIDPTDFRLLQRTGKLRNSGHRIVSECEYTERFPARSIPTIVRFREYMNDKVVFESTREMTAFDPNPIFTENEFGLPALGLPPGSEYLDETTERFVKWNGSETISPDFANHPLVDRDLIARKAAEEAKNNGWSKQYPMYAIAGIGILAVLLFIYRQRLKKS